MEQVSSCSTPSADLLPARLRCDMPERAEPQEPSCHFKECPVPPAHLPPPCCLLSDPHSVQAAGHSAWFTSHPPTGWGPRCLNEERFSLVRERPAPTFSLGPASPPARCAIGWVCMGSRYTGEGACLLLPHLGIHGCSLCQSTVPPPPLGPM